MPGIEWIDDAEIKCVTEVLNNKLSSNKSSELRDVISSTFKIDSTTLCSSGSRSLDALLRYFNVQHGDEIIVPSFTFVSVIESIVSLGGTPVIVDVDDTLSLDPKLVKSAIGPKTKGVIFVHMCGLIGNVEDILGVCKQANLYLIEDACQAIGGTISNKYTGTIGHAGYYSFDSNKTITCGEGGAVVTNNNALHEWIESYIDHGHCHTGETRGHDVSLMAGTNSRLSEFSAAIMISQINKLTKILQQQRNALSYIRKNLDHDKCKLLLGVKGSQGTGTFVNLKFGERKHADQFYKISNIPGFYWYNNNWHYYKQWDAHAEYINTSNVTDATIPLVVSIPVMLEHTQHPETFYDKIKVALDEL